MKRFFGISLIVILVAGFAFTIFFLIGKENKSPIFYDTTEAEYKDIVQQTIATGSITPLETIEIKPNISGILSKFYVEEGEIVKKGQLIAEINVIIDINSLNQAQSRYQSAKATYENTRILYSRNKDLRDQRLISETDFARIVADYKRAEAELDASKNSLEIVKKGFASSFSSSAQNTLIRSTTTGMILELPIKKGSQVIQSNNFNAGTTIALVADMDLMIFDGKIDETEVPKLKEGMDLELTIGAIENQTFDAVLYYISPLGKAENGAVQFQIKANIIKNEEYFLRAGLSANASIILDKRTNVLSLSESLIQYEDEKPFIEIETQEQQFEKRMITLGLSDGLSVEIVEGLSEGDKVKVWKKAEGEDEDKKGKRGA